MAIDPVSAAIDPTQFNRLLTMAGPNIAQDLIAQLQIDLSVAKRNLIAAENAMDRAKFKSQSHVIIGLAGTMGAKDLALCAKRLNELAHDPLADPATVAASALQTIQATETVLAYLSQLALSRVTQA